MKTSLLAGRSPWQQHCFNRFTEDILKSATPEAAFLHRPGSDFIMRSGQIPGKKRKWTKAMWILALPPPPPYAEREKERERQNQYRRHPTPATQPDKAQSGPSQGWMLGLRASLSLSWRHARDSNALPRLSSTPQAGRKNTHTKNPISATT